METSTDAIFNRNYQLLLQHLTLKGLQPKTIDAYSRAIRRIGERFDHHIGRGRVHIHDAKGNKEGGFKYQAQHWVNEQCQSDVVVA